jgi:hypothetical protein
MLETRGLTSGGYAGDPPVPVGGVGGAGGLGVVGVGGGEPGPADVGERGERGVPPICKSKWKLESLVRSESDLTVL